jgi:hypothetical protein
MKDAPVLHPRVGVWVGSPSARHQEPLALDAGHARTSGALCIANLPARNAPPRAALRDQQSGAIRLSAVLAGESRRRAVSTRRPPRWWRGAELPPVHPPVPEPDLVRSPPRCLWRSGALLCRPPGPSLVPHGGAVSLALSTVLLSKATARPELAQGRSSATRWRPRESRFAPPRLGQGLESLRSKVRREGKRPFSQSTESAHGVCISGVGCASTASSSSSTTLCSRHTIKLIRAGL